MQPILYFIRKEFKQIFRAGDMVRVIFAVPLIQMLVLGWAVSTEVKNVSLIIADQDNSAISREIGRAFSHTDRFRLLGYENSVKKIGQAIHNWQAQIALVIPPNFGRDLQRRQQPEVQIIVDGLDGNTAGVALGYASGILSEVAQTLLQQPENRRQLFKTRIVSMQERMVYNLDLKPAQYMIPAIVVVLITIISMMLSAMGLVREKEIGTLEQLMVTPIKRYQLLLGKVTPFLILTFVELGVVLTVAQKIFAIHMVGSYALLAGMAFLFLFTTLGLGIFISTITSSQQQAMFVAWFFMVFMLMMSGFFIPIANMPDVLQKVTYLNPMRYFMFIMREIFQKGATFEHLIADAVPMTVYGLLIFTIGVLNFHKRVA